MADDLMSLTKAQLVEVIHAERKHTRTAEEFAKQADARAAAEREALDAEARVIAACVDALDQLPKVRPRNGVWNDEARIQTSDVERVLAYLATRYGVPDPQEEVKRLRADLAEERQEHRATAQLLSEHRERLDHLREVTRG